VQNREPRGSHHVGPGASLRGLSLGREPAVGRRLTGGIPPE